MKRILFICLFGVISSQIPAQLSDDFSDGNITSEPVWFGDIDDFRVNKSLQLQLYAETAGNSILCSTLKTPDSIRWEMYINLQFATSSTNKLRIYLLLDTINLSNANGYFFEIGQNGTADPLHFFSLENGQDFLLGSSTMTFDEDVDSYISILRDVQGNWTFYAGNVDGASIEILRIQDTTFLPEFNNLFCLECYYTDTRKDKFYFDEITVKKLEPDTIPPILIEVNAIDENSVELTFSEIVGPDITTENVRIEPGIGNPSTVTVFNHKLLIELDKELVSGGTYTCSTQYIKDTAQNVSAPAQMLFEYIRIVPPGKGDIVINEVLFDPKTGDSPFIELYNTSDQYLNCNDIVLAIDNHNSLSTLPDIEDCIIGPDSFIVFTNDRYSTISNYPSSVNSVLFEVDLPSISRELGSIIIFSGSGNVIDSVYYNEDFHHELLDDSRGVSLERISPTSEALNAINWHSASEQSGWGTPGLPNSQFVRFDSVTSAIHLENRIFSPDGDGHEDFLLIRFADSAAGQLATGSVYDEFGREVYVLFSNELIGIDSTGKWDGTEHALNKAPAGIYILLIEMMSKTGIVTNYKESVILAAGF